ncbi:adenylosuccinate synthase [Candidatus Dependentiae bacterium]|nr:adenylosuccinate synthase [Candidatus Dependentiae bacterium]
MSIVAIIGLQWGDEGKGKITDVLAADADLVVRFQGGANAGHTLVVGSKVIRSHLIPSGILHKDKISVIGSGCVFDPEIFDKELTTLKKLKIKTGKIVISNNAHVVFPFHKLMDGLKEAHLGKAAIGTTKMGIGPCYSDRVNRIGIRVSEIINSKNLKSLLIKNIDEKNFMLKHRYKQRPISLKKMLDWAEKYKEIIKGYTGDTEVLINDYADKSRKILFEGAQGTFLDLEWGTYPYVTSSNTIAGNIYLGGGLSPKYKINVIGVVKAYSTRVGNGPFPGELDGEISELLREKGNEYGATTGRPRRVGWLNLDLLKFAVLMNGVSSIALTKLDVLSGFDEIGVFTGTKNSGRKKNISKAFLKTNDLKLKLIKGWQPNLGDMDLYKELPKNAKSYIKFIEKFLNTKASIVSLGAQRSKYILREAIWK